MSQYDQPHISCGIDPSPWLGFYLTLTALLLEREHLNVYNVMRLLCEY